MDGNFPMDNLILFSLLDFIYFNDDWIEWNPLTLYMSIDDLTVQISFLNVKFVTECKRDACYFTLYFRQ